jgi:Tol biopolymer transport system component
MSSPVFAVARVRELLVTLVFGLFPVLFTACAFRSQPNSTGKSTPNSSSSPARRSMIAYVYEGQLRTIFNTGEGMRDIASPPPGESINEFLWSNDGNHLYFTVGREMLSAAVADGKKSVLGALTTPEGTALDRLESSRNPQVIIVHAFDADAAPRIYSFAIDRRETRELTVDEYASLAVLQSPTVRRFSDLSVSPDVTRVLFKGAVGTNEQLFVADLETGARLQVTTVDELDGFEDSAEASGGRKIIEAEWSPDGRFILFNPAQSCSDSGLCYGYLFLVDAGTRRQIRLSKEMMVGVAAAWDPKGEQVVFEDNGKVMIAGRSAEPKALADGNHPKWQPVR